MREDVDLIREVFNYAKRFRGATFVFKIDCMLFDNEHFHSLIQDLALLQSNDINIVLIAGAKDQIDQVLNTYNISYEIKDGIRISSPEAIQFIKMAAFDVSNKLMTHLSAHKLGAVIGNWVTARTRGIIDGTDYKRTGVVDKIRVDLVKKVQSEGLIPIFPCIGWSNTGVPYNISSNELARVVSIQLGADKLFFVNTNEGILQDGLFIPSGSHVTEAGRISQLSAKSAREFLDKNPEFTNPNKRYIEHAIAACDRGVKRVHIVDGRIDGVILKEIFSTLGYGMMVHGNRYDFIRPMSLDDLSDVYSIMKPLIASGTLIERSEESVRKVYRDYYVYAIDGIVHGCAALHDLREGIGEIAAIAVDPAYSHLGIGKKLVTFLLEEASVRQFRKVFVLTTQAFDWFDQLGFKETSPEDLPEERRKRYDPKRKSKVLSIEM